MIDTGLQLTGRLTDVQRFSTDDGPGIRTTVFFKGCNLHCAWCHNPETQLSYPQIMYYANKCTHCGACTRACKYHLQDCEACGECVDACPNDARQLSGRVYTVDELFAELKKDALFYQTSGGGITCSGGECLLQIDFLAEILRRCKEAGISTAVDTAGAVDFAHFERILPYTDLFLYDVKAADAHVHNTYTGVDNALILDNLQKLIARGARVWVRIPVIGGVNDSITEMQAINARLQAYGGVERVELLPYHKLGEHKYEALKMPVQTFITPTKEQLQEMASVFDFPTTVR